MDGIVASSQGRILGCSYSAKVIYSEKVTARTDFSYDIYIGGIFGENRHNTISNALNNGSG